MSTRIADELELNREFDSTNMNWTPPWHQNMFFLQAIQNQANELLHLRGFVTMNEVYDRLGFEQTEEGALTGWVRDVNIDFNLPSVLDKADSIPLEFNVNSTNVFRDK